MTPVLPVYEFKKLLPKICDKKTSSDPDGWTPQNPLWGHCAVVSLVAQNLFGGELFRASLENTQFAAMRSHYWNLLPYQAHADFTRDQFGNSYPELVNPAIRERSYLFSSAETLKRYKLLAWRLAKELNEDNILFRDPIYCKCFCNALDSPCQKMKFGAVIVNHSGERNIESALEITVKEGYNKTIEPLKSLCEPTCIRFAIPSRTESMIGACGHAEENALYAAVKIGVPLHKCDLYVAGIYPNGLPYIKTQNEFTCLRCAVQIYNFGINRVWVPTTNGWQSLTGEECVKTALAYATSEKKI